MKPHPFVSALAASAYIAVVAVFLRFLGSVRHDTSDTLLDGAGFISLFVLSVAVMAFLFFYEPLSLLLEGKRKEAVSYFLKTLLVFGVVTVVTLILVSVQ